MQASRIHLAAALLGAAVLVAQQRPNPDLGFKDTPMLPNQKWHVHDPDRPYPPVVTPASTPGGAPSDGVMLFDGKDLSKWGHQGQGAEKGKFVDAKWPVRDGYFECAPRTGGLLTRD
jgi:hypothetical protein